MSAHICILMDSDDCDPYPDLSKVIKWWGMSYDFQTKTFAHWIAKSFQYAWQCVEREAWLSEGESEWWLDRVEMEDEENWFMAEVKRLESQGVRSLEFATVVASDGEFRLKIEQEVSQ